MEYIEYDVDEMGEPCFIEPHVDNKSAASQLSFSIPATTCLSWEQWWASEKTLNLRSR